MFLKFSGLSEISLACIHCIKPIFGNFSNYWVKRTRSLSFSERKQDSQATYARSSLELRANYISFSFSSSEPPKWGYGNKRNKQMPQAAPVLLWLLLLAARHSSVGPLLLGGGHLLNTNHNNRKLRCNICKRSNVPKASWVEHNLWSALPFMLIGPLIYHNNGHWWRWINLDYRSQHFVAGR